MLTKKIFNCLRLLFIFGFTTCLQAQIISTVAGNGSTGDSGDGGAATSAELNFPEGVAVDSSGNLYIADQSNCVIRRVDAVTKIITTVAGMGGTGGTCGYGGDNGPATSAALNFPQDVAVDSSGNLYIADRGNCVIRKVTHSTGIITTVAGIPLNCGYTGDYQFATNASLNFPEGVTVDGAGNLYIADTRNCVIRKVDAVTQVITTVAGSVGGSCAYGGDGGPALSAFLNHPTDVVVDKSGNLYIADASNCVIRKVNHSTQIITTIAGTGPNNCSYGGDGGPATSAKLNDPKSIALDSLGNLYIADSDNSVIRKVTRSTGIITTVAGIPHQFRFNGDGIPATSATLNFPVGVAVDRFGNIFIGDTENQRVREVSTFASFRPTIIFIQPNHGPSEGGTTVKIIGTNFDSSSIVYFGETRATRFFRISSNEIIAVSPPGIGTVEVNVITSKGPAFPGAKFTYE